MVNLRPEGDHPARAPVVVDLARVAAILQRVAADVDELARARRVADLGAAAALPDRRAERRRRVAGRGTPGTTGEEEAPRSRCRRLTPARCAKWSAAWSTCCQE